MHWSGEQDWLNDEQVALHKRQLARLSDVELRRSYALYLRALATPCILTTPFWRLG
jgi:hypothetical protein